MEKIIKIRVIETRPVCSASRSTVISRFAQSGKWTGKNWKKSSAAKDWLNAGRFFEKSRIWKKFSSM